MSGTAFIHSPASCNLPGCCCHKHCAFLTIVSLFLFGLLLANTAHATEDPDPELLVIDAVPISIDYSRVADTSGQAAVAPPYSAIELNSLPHQHPLPVREAMTLGSQLLTATADENDKDRIAKLESVLGQIETTGNAYNPVLVETLNDLGIAFERAGDSSKALGYFQRANYLVRVNKGLNSLEQEPLLHHIFDNYVSEGDLVAADEIQQQLYSLRSTVFRLKPLARIPALQEMAEWNLRIFHRHSGQATPALPDNDPVYSRDKNQPIDLQTGPLLSRISHLNQAQQYYQEIIDILSANNAKADPRFAQTEFAMAACNYLLVPRLAIFNLQSMQSIHDNNDHLLDIFMPQASYSDGYESLQMRLETLSAVPATTAAELVHARLDLVDWLIATNQKAADEFDDKEVRQLFEQAYREYVASGADDETVNRLFNPVLPVVLPAFQTRPNTRQALHIAPETALAYRGFLDVEYGIGLTGEASDPKVLYRSPQTSPKTEEAVLRFISRNLFRPHMEAGKMAPYQHVAVRYYFAW